MRKKLAIIISSILILAAAVIGSISAVRAWKSAGDDAVYYTANVTEDGMLDLMLLDSEENELFNGRVEMKLPAFEGLFETDGAYYGVFSASDAEAAATRFVIVGYDETLQETGICRVTDTVTYDASSASGIRLMRSNGVLWLSTVSAVRTGDETFAADVTYMIDAEDMVLSDVMYHFYDVDMRDHLTACVYEDEGTVLAVINDQEENVVLYRMTSEAGRIAVNTTECVFFNAEQSSDILEKAMASSLIRIESAEKNTEDMTEKVSESEVVPEEENDEENDESDEADIEDELQPSEEALIETEETDAEDSPDENNDASSEDGTADIVDHSSEDSATETPAPDAELLPTEKEPVLQD